MKAENLLAALNDLFMFTPLNIKLIKIWDIISIISVYTTNLLYIFIIYKHVSV
jgi:hypothetical protein